MTQPTESFWMQSTAGMELSVVALGDWIDFSILTEFLIATLVKRL